MISLVSAVASSSGTTPSPPASPPEEDEKEVLDFTRMEFIERPSCRRFFAWAKQAAAIFNPEAEAQTVLAA